MSAVSNDPLSLGSKTYHKEVEHTLTGIIMAQEVRVSRPHTRTSTSDTNHACTNRSCRLAQNFQWGNRSRGNRRSRTTVIRRTSFLFTAHSSRIPTSAFTWSLWISDHWARSTSGLDAFTLISRGISEGLEWGEGENDAGRLDWCLRCRRNLGRRLTGGVKRILVPRAGLGERLLTGIRRGSGRAFALHEPRFQVVLSPQQEVDRRGLHPLIHRWPNQRSKPPKFRSVSFLDVIPRLLFFGVFSVTGVVALLFIDTSPNR
jgi:hypothetical protein